MCPTGSILYHNPGPKPETTHPQAYVVHVSYSSVTENQRTNAAKNKPRHNSNSIMLCSHWQLQRYIAYLQLLSLALQLKFELNFFWYLCSYVELCFLIVRLIPTICLKKRKINRRRTIPLVRIYLLRHKSSRYTVVIQAHTRAVKSSLLPHNSILLNKILLRF